MTSGNRIYIADKQTLDKVYHLLEQTPIYGFIEHNDIADFDRRIEYIGANRNYTPMRMGENGTVDPGSWADFPWLLANKPWMVHADGTPDYPLDENDYTRREDGTASDVAKTGYSGGAFSWIKRIYKNEYMAGNDRVVRFCMAPLAGFEPVGFLDGEGNVLEGVWLPMFYGAVVGSSMRSIAGTQPTVGKTVEESKTAIDAFGSRARFFGGAIACTLADIMVMLAKTVDLASVFGHGNSKGYDASANLAGVKSNGVLGGGRFYATDDKTSLNKAFHSLIPVSNNIVLYDPYLAVLHGIFRFSPDYTYDLTANSYENSGITMPVPASTGWYWPQKVVTLPGLGGVPMAPYTGTAQSGAGILMHTTQELHDYRWVAARYGHCNVGNRNSGGGARCVFFSDSEVSYSTVKGAAVLLLPPAGMTV